ncbi:MAG: DNA polymerase III subunit alpha, partial [Curvibacter sp.]
KSAMIEARASEALLNTYKDLLKDDELIIVEGKAMPDRFSGGMQLTVQQIWSLEQARCRFGKYLRVPVQVDGKHRTPDVAALVREFPAVREQSEHGELVRGLSVRLQLLCQTGNDATLQQAAAELHLGESAKFFPSDAALASWRAQASGGVAAIAYD